jgi:hypothetical protein
MLRNLSTLNLKPQAIWVKAAEILFVEKWDKNQIIAQRMVESPAVIMHILMRAERSCKLTLAPLNTCMCQELNHRPCLMVNQISPAIYALTSRSFNIDKMSLYFEDIGSNKLEFMFKLRG